jgi:ATP-dependent metalloprotease
MANAYATWTLQSIAAATTDLWPSIATSVMAPWRHSAASMPSRHSHRSGRKVSSKSPAGASPNTEPQQAILPEFLRDASFSSALPLSQTSMPPTNIRSVISSMSERAILMANPFQHRPYRRLATMPVAAMPFLGLRSLHTSRLNRLPLSPFSSLPILAQQPALNVRGFGTGGISHSLLANREAAANRNPNSATAQNAFYQVLLKANMPAIVVERYQSGMTGR